MLRLINGGLLDGWFELMRFGPWCTRCAPRGAGQNLVRHTAAPYPLHVMADAAPQKSDDEPVLARPQPLILPSHPPSALQLRARPGPAPVRRPGASPSYEATGSSSGTPMIERILIIRRDSTRETCIWLVPIFSAISA